tara:strand:+ start:11424 stop:11855 length:432 start_codon:yes stop_codon:yes gene_type:complete
MAYWLLYDILEEEGLLDEYGFDKIDPYKHYGVEPEITGNVTLGSNKALYKYDEDKVLEVAREYISRTYSGHYTSEGSNVQTLDLIEAVGDAKAFCRCNAIKYLSRYEKKGRPSNDILKAIHYCVLLYHFNKTTEPKGESYETF